VIVALITIFQVYLVLLGLQLLSWPILARIKVMGGGWATGRLIISLSLALLIWFGAHLGFRINTEIGVMGGLFLIGGFNFWPLRKMKKKKVIDWWRKNFRLILIQEGLFIFGFFFLAIIRGFNPDILDLEKFMDFGFINSYLTNPILPAKDMWWAGESINYYSFGHFWASIMIRIFGQGAAIGYNLMLSYICGLSLALSFLTIINLNKERLISRGLIIGGIIGSFLVTLGGNSQMVWCLFKNGGIGGYWYPDATRFIYHTIHEFPGYSFVVSDLHGHLLDLPIIIGFIFWLAVWIRKINLKGAIVGGTLLGIMVMTNTWDLMIYGLLLAISFLFLINKNNWIKLAVAGIIIILTTTLTALPWGMNFSSITQGVSLVNQRSPWWQLMVLWSIHLFLTLVALYYAFRKKKRGIIMPLGLTAIVLLLIPELVYVRDIYTTYPRANTMFKLTYQAFVMMGLLGGWAISQFSIFNFQFSKINWVKLPILLIFGLITGGLMMYPVVAFSTYYHNFKTFQGLDGLTWFRRKFPGQNNAVNYLAKNRSGLNLIEAVGDSYTNFNAVSAFSGTPTVVGWKVHEWLWRGGYDQVSQRANEVKNFYETTSVEEAKRIIKKYRVGFVVIGINEKENYQINENVLLQLGEVATESGGVKLLKIAPTEFL